MKHKLNQSFFDACGLYANPASRFVSIRFGGGITAMSGSMAGNTWARNRSGAYMRNRTVPTNPKTARQVAARAALTELTERWSGTLTDVQRTAWNLYAASVNWLNRLGEVCKLTGFNMYIRSNHWLARLGGTIVDDGPVIFELPAHDPGFSIAASEATQQITWNYDDTLDWANETDAWLLLNQGSPQNAQRSYFGGPWRYISQLQGVTGAPPASPFVSGVAFAIAEGQRQWASARILRADGRISTLFEAQVVVAA